MRRASILLLLFGLLSFGCVTPDPAPRFTPAWEDVDTSAEGWISTRRALLCADCQYHNLYSKALPERNLSAETLAATAIRPPQLDMFSGEVLKWILETDGPKADVILHLGDAANLATTGEFDRFLTTMSHAGRPWFMAPGNHDVFYLGTYSPTDEQLLADAAFRSGKTLEKGDFIRLYVATILKHDEPGCAAFAKALGIDPDDERPLAETAAEVPATFDWRVEGESRGYLRRIGWKIDEAKPWRSYILQCVSLSRPGPGAIPIQVYLLDSCQYPRRPKMTPNAWSTFPVSLNCGLTGQMLPDQLRQLRAWLEERKENSGALLMCHHNFEVLEPRTKANLGWLWREFRAGMMVSAHTHAGFYRHLDLGGEREVIELNIGSTTDWPMEWRTLQAFLHVEGKLAYIQSDRNLLVDRLQAAGGYFEPGWEVPLGAPDDYRRYKQGTAATGLLVGQYLGSHYTPYWAGEPKGRTTAAARQTEDQIKQTMLFTYERLLRTFPTDPARPPAWPEGTASDADVLELIAVHAGPDVALEKKIDVLVSLEAFEASRHSHDPETGESTDEVRVRFKISQAAWASRFMKERGRRLRVEDERIRIDWERSLLKTK